MDTQPLNTLAPDTGPPPSDQSTESSSPHQVAIFPDANQAQTAQSANNFIPSGEPNTTDRTPLPIGSHMPVVNKKVPIGVYMIVGFNLIGFVISFLDTSQNSLIYTIVIFVDLLLGIGLLLRLEVARKIITYLMGITLILSVVSIFLLASLQQKLQKTKTNYETAISQLDQSKLSVTQKQQLDSLQTTLATNQKQVGKVITFTYIKLGITIIETVAVIIYLTRPGVKEVFEEMKK